MNPLKSGEVPGFAIHRVERRSVAPVGEVAGCQAEVEIGQEKPFLAVGLIAVWIGVRAGEGEDLGAGSSYANSVELNCGYDSDDGGGDTRIPSGCGIPYG